GRAQGLPRLGGLGAGRGHGEEKIQRVGICPASGTNARQASLIARSVTLLERSDSDLSRGPLFDIGPRACQTSFPYGQAARDRGVARQGADDLPLPRRRLRRGVVDRART